MRDTLLIVGQDQNAETIASTLLERRLPVRSVTDPSEACDIICCEGAAVVVLDLTYPDTRGFEILRRLRGRFETRTLPTRPGIVVVADWPESAVERLAVGLGADIFLRKPVMVADLLATVDQLLSAACVRHASSSGREPPLPA